MPQIDLELLWTHFRAGDDSGGHALQHTFALGCLCVCVWLRFGAGVHACVSRTQTQACQATNEVVSCAARTHSCASGCACAAKLLSLGHKRSSSVGTASTAARYAARLALPAVTLHRASRSPLSSGAVVAVPSRSRVLLLVTAALLTHDIEAPLRSRYWACRSASSISFISETDALDRRQRRSAQRVPPARSAAYGDAISHQSSPSHLIFQSIQTTALFAPLGKVT